MPEIINLTKRHEDGALAVGVPDQKGAKAETFVLLDDNKSGKNKDREVDSKFSQVYQSDYKGPCTTDGPGPEQREGEHRVKLPLSKPSRKRLHSPLTDIVYAYEWRTDDETLPFQPPSASELNEDHQKENPTGPNCEPAFLIPGGQMQYGRRRRKVLVVLDDSRQASPPVSLLGDAYELLLATDKQEVLNLVRHGDFDLVIFGCRKPDHKILEVAKELKARCPQVPLMVVASEASGELVAEMFRAGVQDCLVGDEKGGLLRERVARVIGVADVEGQRQSGWPRDSNGRTAGSGTPIWQRPPAPYGIPHHGIRRAVKFIHIEYTRKLSLSEIAGKACLSRRHFTRMFRKLMGLRPVEYVNRVRVEAAKYKLRQSELSIAEIGLTGGFQTLSYFYRVFKRLEGTTPGTYRRKMRWQKDPMVQ